jgi:hypothetical protein
VSYGARLNSKKIQRQDAGLYQKREEKKSPGPSHVPGSSVSVSPWRPAPPDAEARPSRRLAYSARRASALVCFISLTLFLSSRRASPDFSITRLSTIVHISGSGRVCVVCVCVWKDERTRSPSMHNFFSLKIPKKQNQNTKKPQNTQPVTLSALMQTSSMLCASSKTTIASPRAALRSSPETMDEIRGSRMYW